MFNTVIYVFLICHLVFPTLREESFGSTFKFICSLTYIYVVNATSVSIIWWVCTGVFNLMLFRLLFTFFFLVTGSAWDAMLLTSCVSPSTLTDLSCLCLLPERASLSLRGRCKAYLLDYSFSNLHSSVECLGKCNKHFFTGRPIARMAFIMFLALASTALLGVDRIGGLSSL